MWDYDFGAMPVVDDEDRVMGMITDRDIAIAASTKGRPATEISARPADRIRRDRQNLHGAER
jgi:CBS domain-containing protein